MFIWNSKKRLQSSCSAKKPSYIRMEPPQYPVPSLPIQNAGIWYSCKVFLLQLLALLCETFIMLTEFCNLKSVAHFSDDGVNFSIQQGLVVSQSNLKYFRQNDVKHLETLLEALRVHDQIALSKPRRNLFEKDVSCYSTVLSTYCENFVLLVGRGPSKLAKSFPGCGGPVCQLRRSLSSAAARCTEKEIQVPDISRWNVFHWCYWSHWSRSDRALWCFG